MLRIESALYSLNYRDTHLRDYGRLVDVFAVAPPIHTALLLQVGEVDVPARNEALSREVSDHIQPVPAAPALLLFPIHHLSHINVISVISKNGIKTNLPMSSVVPYRVIKE